MLDDDATRHKNKLKRHRYIMFASDFIDSKLNNQKYSVDINVFLVFFLFIQFLFNIMMNL